MHRLRLLVVLLVAVVLGGLASFLARNFLLSQVMARDPGIQTRRVVVANMPLAFGTPLTEDNVSEVDWPVTSRLEGAFASRAELFKDGRRVVLYGIQRDEPILASKVTGPGQRATLSTLIEDGMRAVTVRVDDVRGVAGFVFPNDRVDVVLTRGENQGMSDGQSRAYADVLLQNVKVLAIDQVASERQDKPTVARAVTLEVNTQQAQKVILAQGVGRLSLVLRQVGQSGPTVARRVTVADLGQEELVESAKKNTEERAAASEAPQKAPEPAAVAAVVAPAPQRDMNVLVQVVRNANKREQYSVPSDVR